MQERHGLHLIAVQSLRLCCRRRAQRISKANVTAHIIYHGVDVAFWIIVVVEAISDHIIYYVVLRRKWAHDGNLKPRRGVERADRIFCSPTLVVTDD